MMDERRDARTDGRTWATLNALPHSSNGGGIKINEVFVEINPCVRLGTHTNMIIHNVFMKALR